MDDMSRTYRYAGIGVLLVTLGLYVKTMAPTVSFWDCGEFIACAYTMGVPHPPGSPLYVLLGRVFTLLPIGEVAWRVVLMSALSSALAVWCVYWSTVLLGRRALGGAPLAPLGDDRDWGVLAGGVVAALSLAVSYTMWFNATEAEVYGYSIFFACLGVWLILNWEGRSGGVAADRWLYLIAYAFGLGGGLHLLALLTIPTLLVLVWVADPKLRRLIVLMAVLAVWAVAVKEVVGGNAAYGVIGLSVAGVAYHLYRRDRRACYLLVGCLGLFVLGWSTYAALYIRSGLNPTIDENDPENWLAFLRFLNREQYGTESMLLNMLSPRAARGYQFWDLQMKYFFQQFPFPLLERLVVFRQATDPLPDPVSISLVPYLLGLFGLVWHAGRDRWRFGALLVMFVIMGFGLSLYLNMPDPQPRERHYVFGGMYYAFALWMGLGWTGLVEGVRQRLRLTKPLLVGLVCAGLVLPAGIAARLYHLQDRTGDYIAYDYGYNLLESCEPNSLLFTNGDNDTFPLWFLQEVEGVRRDVRVINLSLLNTNWYIKQLRDREPKVNIPLADAFIDSVLTDTQLVDLYKRVWPEPKVPREFRELGLDVKVAAQSGHDLLRVQDFLVIGIIYWNQWQRPIHFAITIPSSNRLNLEPYLRMVGMTMRLERERDLGADGEALARNLLEKYRFRGVKDASVYKDDNATRLLGNYYACVMALAEWYEREGRGAQLAELFRWAEERLSVSWERYYGFAEQLRRVGQNAAAAEYVERSGGELARVYGRQEGATYDNLLALAGLLLNTYGSYDRAERLYRRAVDLEPARWEAYYELAATLQANGQAQAALDLLRQYRTQHREVDTLLHAEEMLTRALAQPPAQP